MSLEEFAKEYANVTNGDVQETAKLDLKDYDYSEALYNHRAVMISTGANIFGFELEGYRNGNYQRDYVVFTYENEQFEEVLKIPTNNKQRNIYSVRGTFIGNMFYLLTGDGNVKSYDLDTGKFCESLLKEQALGKRREALYLIKANKRV